MCCGMILESSQEVDLAAVPDHDGGQVQNAAGTLAHSDVAPVQAVYVQIPQPLTMEYLQSVEIVVSVP
jgi:hypothetical protein